MSSSKNGFSNNPPNKKFKMPLSDMSSSASTSDDQVANKHDNAATSTHEKIKTLEEKLSQIDEDIKKLTDGQQESNNNNTLDVNELDILIDKLHKYNEIKDTCCNLIERLANIKQLTIKDVYKIYDIDLEND